MKRRVARCCILHYNSRSNLQGGLNRWTLGGLVHLRRYRVEAADVVIDLWGVEDIEESGARVFEEHHLKRVCFRGPAELVSEHCWHTMHLGSCTA